MVHTCNWLILICQLSNDPSLSSLPLLITFLKSYSRPFLGLMPPTVPKHIHATTEPGTVSNVQSSDGDTECQFIPVHKEEHELIEQDVRDRFKRMCEGYFDNVCKKLVIEHKVTSVSCRSLSMTYPYRIVSSAFRNKINVIMKPTSALERFSKIASRLTKR